jgi:hypothetical protein
MIIQNSTERFFAWVVKRILVSLSCVSVLSSSNIPVAFAAGHAASKAKTITTAKKTSTSAKKTSTTAKKKVALTSLIKSASSDLHVNLPRGTKSGVTTSSTLPIEVKKDAVTAEAVEVKKDAVTTEAAEVKKDAVTTEAVEVKKDAVTTEAAEVKKDAVNTESAEVTKDPANIEAVEVKKDTSTESAVNTTPGTADSSKIAATPIVGEVSTSEPIVIDNDEAVQMESTIKYEELPTDEGKTRVKTGAKFPVVISSQITTKTAKKGDAVEARLKYDLKIGDRLIAKKGAVVNGHINYSLSARSAMHSLVSPTRWYRNSGCLGISFDEIINDKGEHLPLVAVPSRAARIVKNKGEGRELGINHDGQVAGPWSQQLRYKALRIGLNAAMAPAGAFSFGAMPIALGVIGAANPSFAFMKPVGLNVRHRRIKGFFWGALGGVPGSWLIEDTVVKGQEAVIKPGDEFLAEFQQEFTGEAASEATMMPNAKSKVHGQVMPVDKKQKGKN